MAVCQQMTANTPEKQQSYVTKSQPVPHTLLYDAGQTQRLVLLSNLTHLALTNQSGE